MDPQPYTKPINVIGKNPKFMNSTWDQNQTFHLTIDGGHGERNKGRKDETKKQTNKPGL